MPDRNMFPENLVQACFQSMQTYYVVKEPENDTESSTTVMTTLGPMMTTVFNDSNVTVKPVEVFERRLRYIDGMNVLGSLSEACFQFTAYVMRRRNFILPNK